MKIIKCKKTSSIFSFLLSVACMCFLLRATAQEPYKLRINPSEAMGTKVSQIFEEVNYIPLETIKESIFGKIDQLYVTKKYFIILDYDTNCILFFFKDGKFHCKIKGATASKTGFHTGTRFFTVNREKSELSFKIDDSHIAVFDFDGKKVREDSLFPSDYYYHLSQNKTIYSYLNFNKKSHPTISANELVWKLDRKNYKTALPYSLKQSILSVSDIFTNSRSSFYESGNDSVITYLRLYDYNIYQLNGDSLWNNYTFIFPQSISLPKDFTSNPIYYDKRFSFVIKENKTLVYAISHFYKLGNLLSFKLESGDLNIKNSFIYNLQSSTLFAEDNIASDSSNDFLPIFSTYGYLVSNVNFLTTDGTYIYTTTSSLNMFKTKDLTANKHIQYKTSIKSYFDKGHKDDNPVIIQIKPR